MGQGMMGQPQLTPQQMQQQQQMFAMQQQQMQMQAQQATMGQQFGGMQQGQGMQAQGQVSAEEGCEEYGGVSRSNVIHTRVHSSAVPAPITAHHSPLSPLAPLITYLSSPPTSLTRWA